jgi:hypothetical protein
MIFKILKFLKGCDNSMLLIATILILVVALSWIIYSTEREKSNNDKLRVIEVWVKILEIQWRFADNATADVRKLYPELRYLAPAELRETKQWKLYYESEAMYFNSELQDVHNFKDLTQFIAALQKGNLNVKG